MSLLPIDRDEEYRAQSLRGVQESISHSAKARRRVGLQIASFIVCFVIAYLILRAFIPIGVHP